MIQFILTIVQDEGKDDSVHEEIDQIIDDAFAEFIDVIMQNYPKVEYHCSVDSTYDCFGDYEEEEE